MKRRSYNASILFSHLILMKFGFLLVSYVLCLLGQTTSLLLNQQGGQWLIFTLLWSLLVWTFLNI